MGKCLICDRISKIKRGKNPFFVKELETGYIVLGDFQFYKGYTLFLCKKHIPEIHLLDTKFKEKFLYEMSLVAEAIFKTFKPKKLNCEILGNSCNHLHWHIFPRYQDDPAPKEPVWIIDKKIRYSQKAKPSKKQLDNMKQKILGKLNLISLNSKT